MIDSHGKKVFGCGEKRRSDRMYKWMRERQKKQTTLGQLYSLHEYRSGAISVAVIGQSIQAGAQPTKSSRQPLRRHGLARSMMSGTVALDGRRHRASESGRNPHAQPSQSNRSLELALRLAPPSTQRKKSRSRQTISLDRPKPTSTTVTKAHFHHMWS